jgi:hypothetical protein
VSRITAVGILAAVLSGCTAASPPAVAKQIIENAKPMIQELTTSVAESEAEKLVLLKKADASATDMCAQASMVKAAWLQAKNSVKYEEAAAVANIWCTVASAIASR